MIRKDREITDIKEIESIIEKSLVCRLAMANEGFPYIVPMCFGYEDNSLYFHSASKGKKLDILRKNSNVCFEFDTGCETKPAEKACKWDMKYKSIVGFGKASFIDDHESKRRAMDIIMRQYSDDAYEYSESALKSTVVVKVEISSMTGKKDDS
ncbi:MAG: pyridoxamine 5'-phosphate oxidase family protein [Desulfobacterales bacterium]|nr:pyridoxamine 5'-phosphate oxidase family protein [Desulfobacterales bacterium]